MKQSIIDDQRTSAVHLSTEELQRYSRHLIMPEVTADGQRRLKAARVLCIGAGGLGSPAALYLSAAGVGTIGIVDFDDVDLSNLQRQILHGTKDVGRGKLESARDRLRDINRAINRMIGIGGPLSGRSLHVDALTVKFRARSLRRDVRCPVCGDTRTIFSAIEHEQFRGARDEETIAAISAHELKRNLAPHEGFE